MPKELGDVIAKQKGANGKRFGGEAVEIVETRMREEGGVGVEPTRKTKRLREWELEGLGGREEDYKGSRGGENNS